jgi:hypothetical protein
MQSNKHSAPMDTRRSRIARHLRKWRRRHGHGVHAHLVRGLSYGVGSGAVSLLILWVENRF